MKLRDTRVGNTTPIISTLRQILAGRHCPPDLRGILAKDLLLGWAHPIFDLEAKDAADQSQTLASARPNGGRQLIGVRTQSCSACPSIDLDSDSVVAAIEFDFDLSTCRAGDFRMLSSGPLVDGFVAALRAASIVEPLETSAEVRLLRLPGLQQTALWLCSQQHSLFPIEAGLSWLSCRHYSEDEFLQAIRARACEAIKPSTVVEDGC